MNKQQILDTLDNPNLLDETTLDSLKEILDEYPFFQAGRMMWIKNLHNVDSIKFNNELKLAAAHINDRTKLFELINHSYTFENKSDEVVEAEIEVQEEPIIEVENIREEKKEEKAELENYFQVDDVFTTQHGDKYDYSHSSFNTEKEDYVIEEEENIVLPTGDLLDYELLGNQGYSLEYQFEEQSISESRSFSDWLNVLKANPQITENEEKEKKVGEKKKSKFDLIDSFLQKDNSNRIVFSQGSGLESVENKDISESSVEEHDDLMTETLANIYIKQKQFLKAIEVLNRLRLKYPKKNIYFARRIEEIEDLIDKQ